MRQNLPPGTSSALQFAQFIAKQQIAYDYEKYPVILNYHRITSKKYPKIFSSSINTSEKAHSSATRAFGLDRRAGVHIPEPTMLSSDLLRSYLEFAQNTQENDCVDLSTEK